jgi:adenylate cyclase
MADISSLTGRLGPWLVKAAAQHRKMRDLHDAFCGFLRDAGIPLWRSSLALELLHPEMTGAQVIWTAGDVQVTDRTRRYVQESGAYENSPVRIVDETNRPFRQRLDASAPDFPLLEELREAGATDYLAVPFPFIDKTRSALITYATQVTSGFGDDHIAALEEATAQLGPYAERHVLRRIAIDLLDTYIGRRSGERVFNGAIERGGAEIIPAAILMADLRGFTRYSDAQPIPVVLETLNEFFDAIVGPIEENGGEVLKFIGDGLLAIFPADGRELGPRCCEALAAAREARVRIATLNFERVEREMSPLNFGMALHAGDIAYGNIGSRLRLDFTAIGPAVNHTSRLMELTKTMGRDVLVSEAFQALCGQPLQDLGPQMLRDVSPAQRIFAIPSEE